MKLLRLLATLAVAAHTPVAALAACPFHPVADMANADVVGGHTSLWRPSDAPRAPIFFAVGLHTDTDGSRRSYSVKDPWGEHEAYDNLCNAMHGYCQDLPTKAQRLARMALVLKASQDNWPADELARTRLSGNVIVMRNGRPCALLDGEYLVSATALRKPHIPAAKVCELDNYADSSTLPTIVIPGGQSALSARGVAVGDLVAVERPGGTTPIFGVIGDTGDAGKLGEASMAMNQLLLDRPPPTDGAEVRRGWDVPLAFVIVFPGSRNAAAPFLDRARIDAAAKPLFDPYGDVLQTCGAAYGPVTLH
jgi:hypothetical protein